MSDPIPHPEIRGDRSFAARDGMHSARSRRVVEGLRGGVAMAEIARREGITERGLAAARAGTETRRRLLESLNSGAETGPCPTRVASGRRLLRKTIPGETISRKTICATRWQTSFPIRRLLPTVCRKTRAEPERAATPWKVSIREPGQQPPSPPRIGAASRAKVEPERVATR